MAIGILLDTNAYTRLLSGHADVVHIVSQATKVYLPVIVLGELKAGFSCGKRETENLRSLETFLMSPKVEVLPIEASTTLYYAQLYRQLRQQGTPIPINDLWIAALTIQHQLLLCTSDKHFDQLKQIPRIG